MTTSAQARELAKRCDDMNMGLGDDLRALADTQEQLAEALRGMCSVWVTVCNSKGWDPDHVSQYIGARAALARIGEA